MDEGGQRAQISRNKLSTRNGTYNPMAIVNTAVSYMIYDIYMKVIKRVNPELPQGKKLGEKKISGGNKCYDKK